MTLGDLYICVTLLAILFTPIVLAGWWLDHHEAIRQAWREYRQRNADHRAAVRMRQQQQVERRPRTDQSPRPRRPR